MQTSIKEKEICQNIFNWYDYYWKKLKKITYTEEDNELTKKMLIIYLKIIILLKKKIIYLIVHLK